MPPGFGVCFELPDDPVLLDCWLLILILVCECQSQMEIDTQTLGPMKLVATIAFPEGC